MERACNQRKITIDKETINKGETFLMLTSEDIANACFNLQSKAGIKLYLYIARHKNKWSFALSSKDFMGYAGVGQKAYTSAFEELVQYGYLEKVEDEIDAYIFHTSRPINAQCKDKIIYNEYKQ